MKIEDAFAEAQLRFGPMGNVQLDNDTGYSIGICPLGENGFQDHAKPFMKIMTSLESWDDAFAKFDKAREDFWEDFWDRNDLWAGVFV